MEIVQQHSYYEVKCKMKVNKDDLNLNSRKTYSKGKTDKVYMPDINIQGIFLTLQFKL